MSENVEKLKMIGVDVAKDKLDIAFDNQKLITIANTEIAFEKLFKKLPQTANICFVMEASGGYEKAFVNYLLNQTIKVAVVNAKRVRDYANAMGAYAKNDAIDAEMIRQYAESAQARNRLQWRASRSKTEQRIESLLKRRQQLVKQKTIEKQHLEVACDKETLRSIQRMIKCFEAEILKVEATIKKDIQQDKNLSREIKRLQKVEGIGEITAFTLLFCLPELGKVSNKEVAALVGVAPYYSKDSGKKSGKRVIYGGRFLVRSVLYMATLSAIRFNPPIQACYQRLIGKGKPKKVAITACMRKLLTFLNAMLKHDTEWNPHFLNAS